VALQKNLVPGKAPDPALIVWVVCLVHLGYCDDLTCVVDK
jgi:hypothetical protein